MQTIVCFLGLIVLSSAQFPQQPYLNIPGVPPPPWQGPLANHINGIPPQDTPEVAAAKVALNQAYSQVLAVLPELPPEERYRSNPQAPTHHVQVPQVPQYNQHLGHHNIVPQGNPVQHQQSHILAEAIPRSIIGEVPEVHAARVAHLKAYQEAAAALPRLAEVTTPGYQHVQPQYNNNNQYTNQYNQYNQSPLQDTPEVARAKAEHAAAVAALG